MPTTVDVSVLAPTIDIVFPAGTTVDVAIDTPIVEVAIQRPTIDIQVGGSVPGSGKIATIIAPSGTAAFTMPAGARMSDIVVFGSGGGTVTVEKQTTSGELFTDETYSADGNPVLFRPVYFQSAETLGFTATGEVTIKIYYQ